MNDLGYYELAQAIAKRQYPDKAIHRHEVNLLASELCTMVTEKDFTKFSDAANLLYPKFCRMLELLQKVTLERI